MSIKTEIANHGMPWEDAFGYSQALRVGNMIYVSGQLSHDETGALRDPDDMAAQIRRSFANLDKLLAALGATKRQIVNDLTCVVKLHDHFNTVAEEHRRYFGDHRPASTTIGVVALAFPEQLFEIAVTVCLDLPA
jgi:2-iminobutanoate/2-iminopropanoate deaminase